MHLVLIARARSNGSDGQTILSVTNPGISFGLCRRPRFRRGGGLNVRNVRTVRLVAGARIDPVTPVTVSFVPNPGGADGALLAPVPMPGEVDGAAVAPPAPVPMPDDGDEAVGALLAFVPVPAAADPAFAPPPNTKMDALAMTAVMTKGINLIWGIGRSPLPNH
jgi:hypothetical protein